MNWRREEGRGGEERRGGSIGKAAGRRGGHERASGRKLVYFAEVGSSHFDLDLDLALLTFNLHQLLRDSQCSRSIPLPAADRWPAFNLNLDLNFLLLLSHIATDSDSTKSRFHHSFYRRSLVSEDDPVQSN